jgi:hypothetical protein
MKTRTTMYNSWALIFDTETTGLIPDGYKTTPKDYILERLPYILQLSFIIVDLRSRRIVRTYDAYIKVPDQVQIPEAAHKVHGITKEKLNTCGIPIKKALQDFYNAYMHCNIIVAHNLDFDRRMVELEVLRNSQELPLLDRLFKDEFDKQWSIHQFCTMKASKELCQIPFKESTAEYWKKRGEIYKAPTLSELYQKLFGIVPINLHNSLADSYICLECFLQLSENMMKEPVVFPERQALLVC